MPLDSIDQTQLDPTEDDDLGPAKGIFLGIKIGAVIWAILMASLTLI